jgi:zinc transporter 9
MDYSLQVILMCLGMFLCTFFFGYLPTRIKSSQRIMNLIAIYGAGLLVGAALVVIIPEGMSIVFSSMKKSNQKETLGGTTQALTRLSGIHIEDEESEMQKEVTTTSGLSLIAGFTLMLFLD